MSNFNGGKDMTTDSTLKVDGIFQARSTWEEAQIKPAIKKELTGEEIIQAFWQADASSPIEDGEFFKMGEVRHLKIPYSDDFVVGTWGNYPSACMMLLVDGSPLIDQNKTYPIDTKICVIHCYWLYMENYKEHSLPMLRNIYRSICQAFVSAIKVKMRLMEERVVS